MATHPDALLISAVVRSGEYQLLAAHGISAHMFHAFPEEAAWLESYIQRHGKAPSKQALKQQFPDFVIYKVDDTEHWCEDVKKAHKRQALVDVMDTALNLVDGEDEEAALAVIQQGVTQIQSISAGLNSDFDIFDNWESIYENVSTRVDRVAAYGWAGVPSGFPTLDNITGGWQGGWFGVIAARLGQGKTWTGIKMGWSAASSGHRVCYFSLEQSRFQIGMRMHAFGSRKYAKAVFNPMDLNRGNGFSLIDYKKFLKELKDRRGDGRFYVNDTSRGMVTPSTVAAVIEQKQPDICFIDYLTLLGASTDDWKGTAKLSSDLQSVAQRYNVPVVAMSQVNRLGIGKEPPGAEHLSQADAIGHDADVVVTQNQRTPSVMKMKLAKFRHGPGGDTWYARFSPGTGEYDEVSVQDAEAAMEADLEED